MILKLLILKINWIIIIIIYWYFKYIDTSKLNTLATNVFNTRLAQANLITKTDFNSTLSSLNRKISKNKADHLIDRNEINKIKDFDSGYFIAKSHFEEDGTQRI